MDAAKAAMRGSGDTEGRQYLDNLLSRGTDGAVYQAKDWGKKVHVVVEYPTEE